MPDLDWAGFDGKNLRWGLKPAEKTIIYSTIADGNCSNPITNPITLETDSMQVKSTLEKSVSTMRTELAELKTWFETNQNEDSVLRVHTGSFVGAAAA